MQLPKIKLHQQLEIEKNMSCGVYIFSIYRSYVHIGAGTSKQSKTVGPNVLNTKPGLESLSSHLPAQRHEFGDQIGLCSEITLHHWSQQAFSGQISFHEQIPRDWLLHLS